MLTHRHKDLLMKEHQFKCKIGNENWYLYIQMGSHIKYLFKTQEKREKGKYNVNWPLGTTIIIYNNTDSKFLETQINLASVVVRYVTFVL